MSRICNIGGDQKTKNYQEAIQNVVDHLKCKRDELRNELHCDEQEKAKVMNEISHLQDRLSILEATIKKKCDFTRDYDKAITESEKNFAQLLRKSEDFLALTRREALTISHGLQDRGKPFQDEYHKNVVQVSSSTECPKAILAINPPDPEGCVSCSNTAPCTTIMVPYRANGL